MFKIITGMHKGELKHPFDKQIENDSNLPGFYNFLEGKKTYKVPSYMNDEDYQELKQKMKTIDEIIFECDSNVDGWKVLEILKDKKVKEVEIMGSWATYCVAGTVFRAVEYDMKAYVPDDKIFYSDTSKNYYLKWGVDLSYRQKENRIEYTYKFSEGLHVFERQYEFKLLNAPKILDGPPSNFMNKIRNIPHKLFDKFVYWFFEI